MKRLVLALLPWLVTALVAGGALRCYNETQREVGRLQERMATLNAQAESLAARARVVDTVYRTDTLRLSANLSEWRSLVARLNDSLHFMKNLKNHEVDTIRVPVEVVREVVVTADSTIQACTLALQTCEQRVAVRDSLLAVERQRSAVLARQRPSALKVWGERALWLALVFTAAQR